MVATVGVADRVPSDTSTPARLGATPSVSAPLQFGASSLLKENKAIVRAERRDQPR